MIGREAVYFDPETVALLRETLTTLGPAFRRSCRPRCRRPRWPNASSNRQRAANAIESACVLLRWILPPKRSARLRRKRQAQQPPEGVVAATKSAMP